MSKLWIVLSCDTIPCIPPEIARCPICGEHVVIDIEEFEPAENGLWQVSKDGVHATCASEPEIDSAAWRPWHWWHFATPYVDWLPVEWRIVKWLRERYRFWMQPKKIPE